MSSKQEKIKERNVIRSKIAGHTIDCKESALLLISDSLDDYIEHRIETDKVLEGILKDIQGDIACINDRQEVESVFPGERGE